MKRTEPLEFHRPASLAEATSIMLERGPGGHFLAGGTDLVIAMKEKGLTPRYVVDLKGIPSLSGIREEADGDALFGMYKGFDELARLGWIRKRPRMAAAEMAGSLTAALASGRDVLPEIPAPTPYVAGSINVNQSTYQALHALRGSRGTARVVENGALPDLQRDLAADEGIYAEPSSLAALAAVGRLCEEGEIGASDTVVVVNTATGLKDPAAAAARAPEIPTVGDDAGEFLGTLKDVYGYRADG